MRIICNLISVRESGKSPVVAIFVSIAANSSDPVVTEDLFAKWNCTRQR
jgi:hypothetical protein